MLSLLDEKTGKNTEREIKTGWIRAFHPLLSKLSLKQASGLLQKASAEKIPVRKRLSYQDIFRATRKHVFYNLPESWKTLFVPIHLYEPQNLSQSRLHAQNKDHEHSSLKS